MAGQIEAPIRTGELEPFPTTIIGVLERMERTCTVPNPPELERAYSTLLDTYNDGIKDFREFAQQNGIPLQGIVQGPYDTNDQDGFFWLNKEFLAIRQDSILIVSESTTGTSLDGREEKMAASIEGSPDGTILKSASFIKSVKTGIGQQYEKVKEISVEFNQENGITRLRIFPTPEPTSEISSSGIQAYSTDITFSKSTPTS